MIQKGLSRPGYEAALDHCGMGVGTAFPDAGCGAGMAASLAAARGAAVSGFDAADALLAIARERVPSGNFRTGDLEAVPFADDIFDLVTGFNAFQFAGDPVWAQSKARVGGRVVVMTGGGPGRKKSAGAKCPVDYIPTGWYCIPCAGRV